MKRLMLLCALVPACSTIGDEGQFPDTFPHGGTGQFRILDEEELGIESTTRGRALLMSRTALDGAMVSEGHLFYTAAPLRDMAEPMPAEPRNEVFWAAFEPRAIYRSPPDQDLGYEAGELVLAAEEDWEGGEVFDPWVFLEEDGSISMYYAGLGGIGVARAPSVDGALTRVAGPVITPDDGGVARRPSVVRGADGALWMYYDTGGSISVARSEDGIEFARIDADPSTPAIDPIDPAIAEGEEDMEESPELFIGHPGAVAIDTSTGRRLVRVYFSSWREDGRVLIYASGTEDGVTFVRHRIPVVEANDARFPAPVLLDARTTLLYFNVPFESQRYQVRTLAASVSPAGVSFAPYEIPRRF